jgi:hypothetical protein
MLHASTLLARVRSARAPSDGAGILVGVWSYVGLAVGALVTLRILARIVFASERAAVARTERRENRALRERLDRYTAR